MDSSTVVIGNVVSLRSDAHIDALGMYVRTLPFLFEFTESETMDQRLRWTTQRLREDERHKEELLGRIHQRPLQRPFICLRKLPRRP